MIGFNEPDATPEAMLADIDARHLQRVLRDVHRIDACSRERLRTRNRDTTGAGSDIEHAPNALWIYPGSEPVLDELGQCRPRNQDPRIDVERKAREPGLIRQIDSRHALANAPRKQRVGAFPAGGADALRINRGRSAMRQMQSVENQGRRLIQRIVGTMTIEDPGAAQPPGTLLDQLANGDTGIRGRAASVG